MRCNVLSITDMHGAESPSTDLLRQSSPISVNANKGCVFRFFPDQTYDGRLRSISMSAPDTRL